MTTPVFDKQLRFVLKMLPPNPKKYTDVNFTFYGGEPLLNKTLIEHSAAKIRYLEKSLRFKSFRFSLALITNGSLINKATIQLVKEYDINIAVSLDGYGEAHDVQRRFINGKGTFKRVLRGLECLNENNVPFALSWTIGPKNIDETPRSIRWLASTFDNPKIAFNIVMGTSPEVHPFKHVGYKSFFKKMHKIYDTLQKLGLKEGRIARYKQWSLSGCLPYLFYCNALGDGALVLLPNGKIGICHAGIMNNEIQFQLPQRIKDPFEDPIFLNWIGKTTLFKKTCYQGCNYFSLCPGGCAYRIQELTGDINAVTDEVCMVEKFLIERAVIEVADHMYG